MPDQTVQLLSVQAPEREEGKLDRGHHPIQTKVLALTREFRVPGEACHWLRHRTACGGRTESLALNQDEVLQGSDGFSCEIK